MMVVWGQREECWYCEFFSLGIEKNNCLSLKPCSFLMMNISSSFFKSPKAGHCSCMHDSMDEGGETVAQTTISPITG